ncbi:filamentous hemagglutinin N-terminal domain-containing protein [Xenorhabdus bovienii]|nr:filamentous hemagglutinin N-terminal domain-containing protein [Xenorhabdus bovienii]
MTSVSILSLLISTNLAIADLIIPDNNKTQANQVNNIPVVDIATPNLSRVSHNVYKEFNVGEQGLVFNNSLESTTSQLAGQLNKNPNLRNRSATLINNEVVGGNPSQLKGLIEVAGDAANVMITNPNGVSINGLSFKNINDININTGNLKFNKRKNLEELNLTKGHIYVGDDGIDATNTNSLSIFGRTLKLDGDIESNIIGVHAGAVSVDMNSSVHTPIEIGDPKPEFSIDTSDLGGIYANRIVIKSTEKGVGVNLNDIDGRHWLEINAPDSNVINVNGLLRTDENYAHIVGNILNDKGKLYKHLGNGLWSRFG